MTKKKTIIEEYRELTENIAVVQSCIITNQREKRKLIESNLNFPSSLGAIDYTKPAVQTSLFQGDLVSAFIKIHDYETEQMELEVELKSLNEQRDKIENIINDLGDVKKKVIMLRIKGCTNQEIADILNYQDKRSVEKIFQRIRKESCLKTS
jgi:DNA-directed RNA polymerase specialized sigma24 family protein